MSVATTTKPATTSAVRTAEAKPAKPVSKRTPKAPVSTKGMTVEQAKSVTDAKLEKTLAPLVKAVVTGLALVTEADLSYDSAKLKAENTRVVTMRAIAKLAEHPSTFAKAGPTKGKPSVEVIATLVGWKRQTFTPLFKGAIALKEANLHNKRSAPTETERELASKGYATEAERAKLNRAKDKAAKQAKSGPVTLKGKPVGKPETQTDGTPKTQAEILSAVSALESMVAEFTKSQGFAQQVGEGIATKLASIGAMVAGATAVK